jgi:hypothetical protein
LAIPGVSYVKSCLVLKKYSKQGIKQDWRILR